MGALGFSGDGRQAPPGEHNRALRRALVVAVALLIPALAVGLGVALLASSGDHKSVLQSAADGVDAISRSSVERAWRLKPESSVHVVRANTVAVIDGDTAVFRLEDGTEERVRLIGIDSPEIRLQRDIYGVECAKQAASLLRRGSPVFLEKGPDKRDGYGRLLAYVWITEPKARPSGADVRNAMLNARMLATGYAKLYTKEPNTRYAELFEVFLAEARAEERGLWSPKFVEVAGPNSEWTPASAPEATAISSPYLGNITSKKFHLAECENAQKMKLSNRVPLDSREQAITGDFIPCGVCDP